MYKWPAMHEIAYIHKWIKGGEFGFGQDISKYPGIITEQILKGVFAFDDGINQQYEDRRKSKEQERKAKET